MKKKTSSLVLMSGGLDSLLVAKLLIEEGLQVVGLTFKSLFFSEKKGQVACQQVGIDCQVVNISQEHLEMVKQPQFGRGKTANPCIDCHLMMLKKAKQIMDQEGFDFIATGEVLGSRPLSQNKRVLMLIIQESGLTERLLRPLSAQLLPKTLAEKKGWVSKKALLAISGRQRQEQMKLAKKFGLSYIQPGGGCILTDKNYGERLLKMFDKWPNCQPKDVKLLLLGRVFWLAKNLVVLGKNQAENDNLEKAAQSADWLIMPENFPGPTALVRGKNKSEKKVKDLILKYSKSVKRPLFQVNRV